MSEHDHRPQIEDLALTRREMISRCGMGFATLGLAGLLAKDAFAGSIAGGAGTTKLRFAARRRRQPHFPGQGQARHPSVHERRPVARRYVRSQAAARRNTPARPCRAQSARPSARPAPRFRRRSSSRSTARAASKSASCSRTSAECIDDICVIRSMHADVPNHEPSLLLMNCGDARQIRPSIGSWVTYGLGSENQNLPGFIAMCPGGYPIQESQNWQSGFLPGVYQGTYIDTQHTDIEQADREHPQQLTSPRRAAAAARSAAAAQRTASAAARSDDAQLEARIQSFELAYRMQMRRGRRLRRQPRAAAHPRHVRPRHAGPADSDRPAAARARRALRAGLARRRASRGTTTTTSKSTIAGSPANATRPSARCSRT